jgi:hypothetical protein
MTARSSRLARASGWGLAGILVIAAGLELFARFYLGLGHPPLSVTHPTIEYMFAPNQSVWRFGNLFRTNRYGMRSDDFPPRKSSPRELRIMVYGDSVVNGGNLTDHSRLATTLLQARLSQSLHRPVIVGNVSAGSWGPPNQLAYIRQFGFLDADVAVFVLSSSDYNDAPTFEPLNPATHPTQAPWSAAWEGVTRYLPRYLGPKAAPPVPPPSGGGADPSVNPRDVEVSLAAEREFLQMARAEGVTAIVLQHWTAAELSRGQGLEGHEEILRVARASGAPVHQDSERLHALLAAGKNPFFDDIHLNALGQEALAQLLFDSVSEDAADRLHPPAVDSAH